jgi:hypothetical protein
MVINTNANAWRARGMLYTHSRGLRYSASRASALPGSGA